MTASLEYNGPVKLHRVALLLFLFPAFQCFAQQVTSPSGVSHRIIIRLLNGRNGKPIRDENPNIWLGNAAIVTATQADSMGEIGLDIRGVRPREIRFRGNHYVDCRGKAQREIPQNIKYSLDEILSTGVVSENDCGKNRVSPTPGVLVLYLRPMTLIENWNL
jgi:hypothetical protein